jgi:hypothetical protein
LQASTLTLAFVDEGAVTTVDYAHNSEVSRVAGMEECVIQKRRVSNRRYTPTRVGRVMSDGERRYG